MNCLKGVGVALVTPFNEVGDVDYTSLQKLVNFVIDGGVDYLVALGTTAETATLSSEEKKKVLDTIIKTNNSRKPIVVGIGGNNTSEVCKQIEEMDFTGIVAVLTVTPYYNKPSQEGIYQHYKAVAGVSKVPVILYNVPGRTGVNMSAATTVRLAREFSNIVAVKEASGNLNQAAYILRDCPEDFLVISGDDNITLALIAQGGVGVISVAANCYPVKFSHMVKSALNGDYKSAQSDFKQLVEATDALFEEGNPTGAKAALAIKGIITNKLRLPLVSSTEALYSKIKNLIEKYDL